MLKDTYMKQITIQVPDTKVEFFLELLHQLGIQASTIRADETVATMQEDDELFIPEWHKEIVRECIRENQNNPERMLNWEEVRDRFELKYLNKQ
jgi:hypothetical protein